jgi:CHRD domain
MDMRTRLLLALPAAGLALSLLGTTPASAHDHDTSATGAGTGAGAPAEHTDHSGHGGHGAGAAGHEADHSLAAPGNGPSPNGFRARFFTAQLSGGQEVPAPGGPKVGDQDGRGSAIVRVQGSRITFSFRWTGIGAPTLGHIHQGRFGVNGAVKVPFFTSPLPESAAAVAGAVTVSDPKTADDIRSDPTGFYVNLHTADFPGGAIRGQLHQVGGFVDVLSIVQGSRPRAFLSGDQEVPVAGGPKVGDPDARAVGFVRARSTSVDYSFAWVGLTPTLGHIHQGRFGVNGDVKVLFFNTPLPESIIAMSGSVSNVDSVLTRQIRTSPREFYLNLHSADFPGGAARGQLF